MRRIGTALLGLVGLAIGILGVLALREATLSTHEEDDPDSEMGLVIEARTEGGEPGQTLSEMVEALLLTCRLEVPADLIAPIEDQGGGRYRTVMQPALDSTDRRQLRGCIEDWTIDGLLVDVVAFENPA